MPSHWITHNTFLRTRNIKWIIFFTFILFSAKMFSSRMSCVYGTNISTINILCRYQSSLNTMDDSVKVMPSQHFLTKARTSIYHNAGRCKLLLCYRSKRIRTREPKLKNKTSTLRTAFPMKLYHELYECEVNDLIRFWIFVYWI